MSWGVSVRRLMPSQKINQCLCKVKTKHKIEEKKESRIEHLKSYKMLFVTCCFSLFFFHHTCLPPACIQRKSNRAKEKKARRLEERAAMDAVCAKVDAANKVTVQGSHPRLCGPPSWFDWIDCPQVESKLVLKCDDPRRLLCELRFLAHVIFSESHYSLRFTSCSGNPEWWHLDRKLTQPVSWLWAKARVNLLYKLQL